MKGARTGDLVFFWSNNAKNGFSSYHNYIASAAQAWATETPYTHVCLVYRSSEGPDDSSSKLHFITADRFPHHDLVTNNKNKTGNHMVDAESYLKEYKGRICWYRLNTDVKIPSDKIEKAFEEFKSNIDHEYYMKLVMMINLGLQTWNNVHQPKKTICTTTAFDFLQTAGIITSKNLYTKMNKMNLGLRELEGAVKESRHYSQHPVTEVVTEITMHA